MPSINDYLRRDVCEFTALQCLDLLAHWFKAPLHPFEADPDASMSQNDFECFASTGVESPTKARRNTAEASFSGYRLRQIEIAFTSIELEIDQESVF
jgi:hypothetical protein